IEGLAEVETDAVTRADLLGQTSGGASRLAHDSLFQTAEVEDEARFAGDLAGCGDSAISVELTDREDEIAAGILDVDAGLAEADDQLRRRGDRVPTDAARRGAGMGIGAQAAGARVAQAAADTRDDADGQAGLLEDWPLLDMHFEKRRDRRRREM